MFNSVSDQIMFNQINQCYIIISLFFIISRAVAEPEPGPDPDPLSPGGASMPFLESCCNVGTSRASSLPDMGCDRIGRSLDGLMAADVPDLARPQCELAFSMCCGRQMKSIACDHGKSLANATNADPATACAVAADPTSAQCCQACQMGRQAADTTGECSMSGFGFGQPFDGAYHECCRSKTKSSGRASSSRRRKKPKSG